MTILHNRKQYKFLRKSLRNSATRVEQILWQKLKNSQLNGHKFRRQQGFGKYVVDFYCPRSKLAVEVDGVSHFYKKEDEKKDKIRQADIEKDGVRFLRFTNTDVYKGLDNVLNTIAEVAEKFRLK